MHLMIDLWLTCDVPRMDLSESSSSVFVQLYTGRESTLSHFSVRATLRSEDHARDPGSSRAGPRQDGLDRAAAADQGGGFLGAEMGKADVRDAISSESSPLAVRVTGRLFSQPYLAIR